MSLKQKAIKSAKWSAVENWASQIVSLLVFMLLARLLQPVDFGLVALASVFVVAFTTLSNQGFSQAIIQREDIQPEHFSAAFWINNGIAILLCLGLIFASPYIAKAFSQPELSSVLRYLSLTLVINSLVGVHAAHLSRNFRFKALAIRSIFSSVVGGGVGLYMAYNHFGVWALVGQQLSGAIVGLFVLWFASSWRPGLKFQYQHFVELFSFSSNVLGISLLGLLNKRLPDLLIGGVLGPVALGIFAIANRVFTVLTQLLVGSLAKIALPTFSRMQNDVVRIRNAYCSAVQITSVICFPIFMGALVTASDLVPFVFGNQWTGSAVVMQYLMIVGLFYGVGFFNGPILMALGHPSVALKLNIINTTLNIMAFIVGVNFGLEFVALAFMVRGVVMFPVGLVVVKKYTSISFITLLLKLRGAIISTLFLIAGVLTVNLFTSDLIIWLRLLLEIVVGGLIYCFVLFLVDRPLIVRVLNLIREGLIPNRK